MLKKIKKIIIGSLSAYKQTNFIHNFYKNDYKSPKVNLGKLQANLNLQKIVNSLQDVEFQVFSQFGDDGIIQWLVNLLPIPNKTFIEFGVENYREANTRFLLVNNYWSGLVIDGNIKNIEQIRNDQISTFYDLQSECSFITEANINGLIASAKFNSEIGLLSVDIDGNDYWIWKSITEINPIIVIIEYNSLFGFEFPYTIAYKADFVRGHSSPFNFYGTSLLSACDLATEKGYSFVGCNSAGNNAYFIRNDFMQYLPTPKLTPQQGYVFASFSETWDSNKIPRRGIEKVKSIDDLIVVNTRSLFEENINSSDIIDSLIKAKKLNRF